MLTCLLSTQESIDAHTQLQEAKAAASDDGDNFVLEMCNLKLDTCKSNVAATQASLSTLREQLASKRSYLAAFDERVQRDAVADEETESGTERSPPRRCRRCARVSTSPQLKNSQDRKLDMDAHDNVAAVEESMALNAAATENADEE